MHITRPILKSARVLGCIAALTACSDSHDSDELPNGTAGTFGNGQAGDDNASGSGASSGSSGSSGSNGSNADPNQPAAPGVPPTFIPHFPGAGTSGDDAALTNGELCDYVPANGAPTPNEITTCFFSPGDPIPAATMEQVLECVDGADVVHIRLTFSPYFADNTYGETAIGWGAEEDAMDPMMPPKDPEDPMMGMMGMMKPPKHGKGGHTFKDLVGSDHAEIILTDENGDTAVQFKIDYISESSDASSGYESLGVTGGEGEMIVGDADWVLAWQTSFALNLNERGYSEYLTDSPATDEDFTPNPATPEWDYRVVYEAWIDVAAFGDVGFGTALIEFVHASPSKADSNTLEVEPGDCPPCPPDDLDCDSELPPCDPALEDCEGEDEPECAPDDEDCESETGDGDGDGDGEPQCGPDDINCDGNGNPPDAGPEYCIDNPSDPICHVD